MGSRTARRLERYLEHKFRAPSQTKIHICPVQFSGGYRLSRPERGHEGYGDYTTAVVMPVQVAWGRRSFGLGYSLLVFVYEKTDDPRTNAAVLNILHTVFVQERHTADYSMTKLILKHLQAGCNAETWSASCTTKTCRWTTSRRTRSPRGIARRLRTGLLDYFQRGKSSRPGFGTPE